MRRGRKNENNGWKNREKTANQQMQREKHKEGRGSETTDRQLITLQAAASLQYHRQEEGCWDMDDTCECVCVCVCVCVEATSNEGKSCQSEKTWKSHQVSSR